jgi:hypothetical protein
MAAREDLATLELLRRTGCRIRRKPECRNPIRPSTNAHQRSPPASARPHGNEVKEARRVERFKAGSPCSLTRRSSRHLLIPASLSLQYVKLESFPSRSLISGAVSELARLNPFRLGCRLRRNSQARWCSVRWYEPGAGLLDPSRQRRYPAKWRARVYAPRKCSWASGHRRVGNPCTPRQVGLCEHTSYREDR